MPTLATPIAQETVDGDNRSGAPKSRYSLNDKLNYLDPRSCRTATRSRVEDFRGLFAYRFTNGIMTRPGKGPGAWTAHRGVLGEQEIIRHLLANHLPGRPSVWYGSRSYQTSKYICIDVDADRSTQRRIPFAERCTLVERALRRMGVNPENPRDVLIQRTPSGGRHYYVFFDAPYSLEQYHDLLKEAGLQHRSGEIEFFPSPTKGLRLPFGYVPGQPHNPDAWIQFIDDYREGRITRYSLADLYERLGTHRTTQSKRIKSLNKARLLQPSAQSPQSPILGMPRNQRKPLNNESSHVDDAATKRFLELAEKISSQAEAEELMEMGIVLPCNRNKVLKRLAAHLNWVKQFSAANAAAVLTKWAMNSRDASKDITHDFVHGTELVAKQIMAMCRWYASHKRTTKHDPSYPLEEFSVAEVVAIRPYLSGLKQEDRCQQAAFLLHFLRFAKLHGHALSDGSGWIAAPAAGTVMRKWPGCHHVNYKTRVTHAVSVGCMEMVKGSWHGGNGPGRARTYRIAVPAGTDNERVMTYDSALQSLKSDELAQIPVETKHKTLSTAYERTGDSRCLPRQQSRKGKRTKRPIPHAFAPCISGVSPSMSGSWFTTMRTAVACGSKITLSRYCKNLSLFPVRTHVGSMLVTEATYAVASSDG